MLHFEKYVKETINNVNVVTDGGEYKLPCNFYKIGNNKRLVNTDGEVFDVAHADLIFIDHKGKEVDNWVYGGAQNSFKPDDFYYLDRCDKYRLYLHIKSVEDDIIKGYSAAEVESILK